MIPNNSDAAFKKYASRFKKPSALLLHYTYGATAVQLWGHRLDLLEDLVELHPSTPVPHPAALPKQIHDRKIAIDKRKSDAQAEDEASKAAAGKTSKCKTRDEGEAAWDEDDAMLFFWGNSRAAKERYIRTSEEQRQKVEQWKRGIASAL